MEMLEEVFIRQCVCDKTEADDFIGYYVSHKKPNEKIVIVSNDRDLTQLIAEDVIVYVQSMKSFINTKNHTDIMGYNYQNVVLKKMLCGDVSDNIKSLCDSITRLENNKHNEIIALLKIHESREARSMEIIKQAFAG